MRVRPADGPEGSSVRRDARRGPEALRRTSRRPGVDALALEQDGVALTAARADGREAEAPTLAA